MAYSSSHEVMNAYHAGTAESWRAYAWQPGDWVLHFAGCPQDEPECAERMLRHVERVEAEGPGPVEQ